MTPEGREKEITKMIESWLGPIDKEMLARARAKRLAAKASQKQQETSSEEQTKQDTI